MDGGRRVQPGQERRVGVGRVDRREGGEIGAEIGDGLNAQAEEAAVPVERQLGLGDVVAALGVGHERLRALRRPLDRAAELPRRPGDDDLLGVVEDLRAEAAADVGRHHAQLVLRDVEHEGAHQQPDDVRVLAGGVERVLVGAGVVLADGRARLHGVGDEALVDEVELRHVVSVPERRLGLLPVAPLPVEAGVVRRLVPDLRGAVLDRVRDGDHGGKLLVVDLDQLGGVARLVTGLGDDDGDRVADMAHAPQGQRRVRRLDHGRAVPRLDQPAAGQAADLVGGHVGAGEDAGDPRGLPRRRGVDAADARVRVRRAQDVGVELVGPVDVVGVAAVAGDEAPVLLAPEARADAALGHGQPFIARAPACTAATMLW